MEIIKLPTKTQNRQYYYFTVFLSLIFLFFAITMSLLPQALDLKGFALWWVIISNLIILCILLATAYMLGKKIDKSEEES